ncbi:MAG: IS5 family transposase [Gammaproteobacteria bacterium]|nr:IS5 family transposase [Gammaproteobacteria bacterium]
MPKKTKYRVRNWHQYNKSLVNRGSITVWISEEIANNLAKHSEQSAHGNQVYSDRLIELCLTLRQVYGRTLRATQGLMQSIFTLMKIKAPVPNYTTLSRRAKKLTVTLNARPSRNGRTLLVDSTGVQVVGGTEWKKIKHKKKGRQLWRKLHVAIDADSQDICAALVTESQNLDGNYMQPLLDHISSDVNKIIGDGAYDKKSCYETAFNRNARPVFPPQHNAIVQRNKVNKNIALTARDV